MKKETKRFIILWVVISIILLVGTFVVPSNGGTGESIQAAMRDAVLHDENRISLFGIKDVNPSLISGITVSAILLIAAVIIRIFVIPRFTYVPGKFQMCLETVVNLFEGMARSNSPWRNSFLGAYIFAAGIYIFCGTIFELFGVQAITTLGHSISLPAPLADVNAAIMMGALSYTVIFVGAVLGNGLKGIPDALKEISLLISMSFRLFGALLSGLLVTELVYYFTGLSYVLPVLVAVLFTLLHALIQSYVLTMLTALFYGEKSEPKEIHKMNLQKAY